MVFSGGFVNDVQPTRSVAYADALPLFAPTTVVTPTHQPIADRIYGHLGVVREASGYPQITDTRNFNRRLRFSILVMGRLAFLTKPLRSKIA